MGTKVILVLFACIMALFATGCEQISERFDPDIVEDSTFPNEQLQNPASRQKVFTLEDDIVLPQNSSVTVQVGAYNKNTHDLFVVVGTPFSPGFESVQQDIAIMCKDARKYDYTIEISSPIVNVTGLEGIAFEIELVDKHAIEADELICPISLVDIDKGTALESKEVTIKIGKN